MNSEQKINNNLTHNVIIKRVLGAVKGAKKSPTIIFFGGIHGNEFAGISGLQKVLNEIRKEQIPLQGNMYAISGNTIALKENKRFIDVDLNRIWTKEQLFNEASELHSEHVERASLFEVIIDITSKDSGPFYFIDLHTTSSETTPFITISDSLNNRKFSKTFSVPTILGIEEFLEGPLLTFINEYGHVALGFEAGQHYKESSIDNCVAFIWLAMVACGCVKKNDVRKHSFYQHYLSMFKTDQEFFEINYRYKIDPDEHFSMLQEFKNFAWVETTKPLALSNGNQVYSPLNGQIFMPLYQQQGDDGFFIISKISKFWLNLSTTVRKLKLHNLLRLMPGISQDKGNKHILIVNPQTARFMATELFHLFGYRKKVRKNNKLFFIKRDREITSFN